MKLSDISSPPPMKALKRGHSKSADRGGFTFDLGKIAFGNSMDLLGRAAKVRKENDKKYGKKKNGGDQARNNYHRKHG